MFSQDKCITLEKFFATLLCLFCFFKMTFCPCLLLAANSIQGEGEGEARQGEIIWTASFSNKEVQIVFPLRI